MSMILDGSNGVTFNDASLQGAAASPYVLKNRIINGAMVIDQRNAGAVITPTSGQYSVDRWKCYLSQTSKYTIQQDAGAVTPPVGFNDYLGVTSSSAYSVTSSDFFLISQLIEGFNTADFAWGTANAKTVTLSFWVRSSLTGTFGGVVKNSAGNRSYPYTYTISTANTWEFKTITIPGDTSGTWLTTNGIGLELGLSLGSGSTYNGTAGSWQAGNLVSATGAVSVVGTSGATFYFTGVQLEQNTSATPFERRLYGQELINCQRYCQKIMPEGASTYVRYGVGFCYATQAASIVVPLLVSMRVAPSLTVTSTPSNYALYTGNNAVVNLSATPTIDSGGNNTANVTVVASVASGLTIGDGALLINSNNTSGFMLLTSEL